MKVHGIALHYFDGTEGARGDASSDKYYCMYLTKRFSNGTTPFYSVTYHWGRDGSIGQNKTETYHSWTAAQQAMEKQANTKIRKGYEYLGEADFETPTLSNYHYWHEALVEATGKTPTKIGGKFVIGEEPDFLAELTEMFAKQ